MNKPLVEDMIGSIVITSEPTFNLNLQLSRQEVVSRVDTLSRFSFVFCVAREDPDHVKIPFEDEKMLDTIAHCKLLCSP
jgi:hypothetical protein